MRSVTKRLGILVVAMAAAIPALVGAPPAATFDDFGPGCGDLRNASIAFSTDWEWDRTIDAGPQAGLTMRQAVEMGRDDWIGDEVRHWKGYWLLGGGGRTFTMHWNGFGMSSDTFARTLCAAGTIDFNPARFNDFRLNRVNLRGLATHEWGHVWGLGHSGRYDSHGGGPPSMSTCWGYPGNSPPQMTAQAVIAQDDSAALQFQTNKVRGGYGAATANPSFEEGTRWWGFQNVSSRSIRWGGQDESVRYLRFSGPSSSTAIYSTTRISDITAPFSDNSVSWTVVKGRANYKKWNSSSYGHVKVVQRIRAREYPSAGYRDLTCQNWTDSNDAATIGPWVSMTRYCYPTTSWGYCTTDTYSVPANIGGTTTESIDVRIVVYNRMKFGGHYLGVDVDRVRALVKLP